MKNKELIREYKKGSKKAFEELVENNMYIVDMALNKFEYKSDDYEDLLQDGYERLIKLINKYVSGTYNYPLSQYLNNSLTYYYCAYIKRIYKNNKREELNYIDSGSNDFILDIEEREIVSKIEDFLFKSDYLEFMRQTILMARTGYINNINLSDKQLASAFCCSRSNVNYKYKNAKELIQPETIIKNTHKQDDFDTKIKDLTDFYAYFRTSKKVMEYFMESLKPHEICLLKKVWGNNFDDINGIKNANISEKEVLEYYKVIYKLYNAITSADVMEVASKTGLGTFHMIKKY